jgi:hypothetical protein
LGKFYDSDLDALPLKERINTMKILKGAMEKVEKRSEGKPPVTPQPESTVERVLNHVQRQEKGLNVINTKNPVFGIKLNPMLK